MRLPRLTSTLLLAACATNPVTGRSELSLVSEAQEIEMGRQSLAGARQQTGFVNNPGLASYISAIGMEMARASERPDLPWEFHVMDDATVNAFAAPGGFIFVTRGILAHLGSEAELAGVLGHEIGHVTARHSASQLSKQTALQAVLIGGAIAAPDLAQGPLGQVAQAGAGFLFLKFGRDDERQSDELGHRYSLEQGYDVREMPRTFATLQRLSGGGDEGRLPAFLSTHPDPGDRVEATSRWADTVSDYSDLETGRDRYLRQLQGMTYGADPRLGYFEGQSFIHPEMRFRFDVPSGWQGVNQADRVVVVQPDGQAQAELSLAAQASAAAAAQAFGSQQGITVTASGRTTVNRLPAAGVSFTANTESGQLSGEVIFVEHGGAVFQLLGLTTAAQAARWQGTLAAVLRSFGPTPTGMTFRRARELNIITLARQMTPTALAADAGSVATAEELALLNGVEAGVMIPAGRLVKTVRYR